MSLFRSLLLAGGLMAASTGSAAAKEGCTWWLSGPIQIQQSNGVAVTLTLQQKPDGTLLGTGEYDVGLMAARVPARSMAR